LTGSGDIVVNPGLKSDRDGRSPFSALQGEVAGADQMTGPLGDSALVFNIQVADVLRKVDARALTVWNKSGGAKLDATRADGLSRDELRYILDPADV
jgi:hypothetical protein